MLRLIFRAGQKIDNFRAAPAPSVTRSRPLSELQVINLFLCREGCGEVFGSCGGDKF